MIYNLYQAAVTAAFFLYFFNCEKKNDIKC